MYCMSSWDSILLTLKYDMKVMTLNFWKQWVCKFHIKQNWWQQRSSKIRAFHRQSFVSYWWAYLSLQCQTWRAEQPHELSMWHTDKWTHSVDSYMVMMGKLFLRNTITGNIFTTCEDWFFTNWRHWKWTGLHPTATVRGFAHRHNFTDNTVGANQPWVLGVKEGEDWFEPVFNIHTPLSPTLIAIIFICPSSTQ